MKYKCKKVVINKVEFVPSEGYFTLYVDGMETFNSYDIGLGKDFSEALNKQGKNIISIYGVNCNKQGIDLIGLEIDSKDIMLYKGNDYYIIFNIKTEEELIS